MTSEELFQYAHSQKELSNTFMQNTYTDITVQLDQGETVEEIVGWLKRRIHVREQHGGNEDLRQVRMLKVLVNYIVETRGRAHE